ncbi:MAG: cyclohexanone monooxygenase [Alphaproteobacteria bacterium]|nr:cyclohexanone monooxygenase [Alphaproteobacteria bacterium]|tara:strand:- start:610 stop:2229 length:1620 start_codon:yes stop_codon:yes gene_type:complete
MSETEVFGEKSSDTFDVLIVGAGFAGLYMLYRMRELGFSSRVFEAGSGVGGTWYWNRYPGARCDVNSMEYSYQFSDDLQQEWEWTERFPTQPEILRYADHVADRFDLRRDIQFNTRVTAASFNDEAGVWIITTDDGAEVSAKFCITAMGCLSEPNFPKFRNIDAFDGPIYHTGRWPHEEVDFTGQRVAVIGTGSSGIQAIPVIAEQAEHLYVFQRTASYSIPARNAPLDPEFVRETKANYAEVRKRVRQTVQGMLTRFNPASALEVTPEERQREYESRWVLGGFGFMAAFADLLSDERANDTAAEFVRGKIRETVKDPDVAEALLPRNIIGAKRLCIDTDYYATFNRPNVTLVDVNDSPIERMTRDVIVTKGEEYRVDSIVFATGFDAITGALLKVDIRGRGGVKLRDKWIKGPRAYLGLATTDFPNLFMITGPGSPSVLSNVIVSIEQHVDWIGECLQYMRNHGATRIEPRQTAEDDWITHVNEVADASLRSKVGSWYDGANIPGKARIFMPYIGGLPEYAEKCADVAAHGYKGFVLS